MPPRETGTTLSPSDRRRQAADILAKGVFRWRRQAKSSITGDAPESPPVPETCLDLPLETSLTVSNDTRGFTPRGDGDKA